jgi:hypothetical protein
MIKTDGAESLAREYGYFNFTTAGSRPGRKLSSLIFRFLRWVRAAKRDSIQGRSASLPGDWG